MYVSRVGVGCGVVSCVGGVTSKLSGFCGCVNGACGKRLALFFRIVCCDDVYDVLWCVVYYVSRWLSKRSHFGLVSHPWVYSRTYFEVDVGVFWAFVKTVIFFVYELLV